MLRNTKTHKPEFIALSHHFAALNFSRFNFHKSSFNIEGIKSAFNRARKPSTHSVSSFSPHSRSPTLTLRRLLPDAESLLSYIMKKRGFIRRFFIKHQPHGNLHRISNSLSSLCERWFNDWIVTIHPGIIFHKTKFRKVSRISREWENLFDRFFGNAWKL